MKAFPRFWRNHPYCRNKWYLIWMGCLFSLWWSKLFFFFFEIGGAGKWVFFCVGHFVFFYFISVEKAAHSYEVSFISSLWMVFPESWKRSCLNFYAHDCKPLLIINHRFRSSEKFLLIKTALQYKLQLVFFNFFTLLYFGKWKQKTNLLTITY